MLTRGKKAQLRIDLTAYEAPEGKNQTAYALYDQFWIGDESSGYTLEEISGYSGETTVHTVCSIN